MADRHLHQVRHCYARVLHLSTPPNHRLAAERRAGVCQGLAWLRLLLSMLLVFL
jgi:hypothetical protein